MTTDGISLDFLFDKRPLPARDLQTPESFANWIEFGEHRTTIWGVDPGITDIFVAVDGLLEDPHRVRQTSCQEYYHLCGYNKATRQRERWRQEAGPDWTRI